jgi:4-amino-4-deoxy-L-arabinose transferase-like glycosyltransferase
VIWSAVTIAVLTVVRAYAAFHVPLTADEAYYWTWSLHPAYGYTDHPPLVAWLIALGRTFGAGTGFVRLPFVLCEAIAALAIGRAALIVSGNVRAGAIAALLFALIPQSKLALGEALPDGAYMAAWGLALWAAAALDAKPVLRNVAGLGLALAAVVLARTFGWALVAGILAWSLEPSRRSRLWPQLGVAVAIIVVAYAPFVVWNAQHDWENFAFTFAGRQHFGGAVQHLTDISTLRFIVYALLLAAVTWLVALRRNPRIALVAWTALPLPAALFVLSFFTTTESYWIIGPAASVALGAGVALAPHTMPRRIAIGALALGTAYVTIAALFLTLPESAQARVFAASPGLCGPLSSGVFVYAPLADRVRALAAADDDAVVFTDRYETAAELRWYGIDARIAADMPQRPQWIRWHAGAPVPQHAIMVTFDRPLSADVSLAQSAQAAFVHVTPVPDFASAYAGVTEDIYGLTQLDEARPGARTFMPAL